MPLTELVVLWLEWRQTVRELSPSTLGRVPALDQASFIPGLDASPFGRSTSRCSFAGGELLGRPVHLGAQPIVWSTALPRQSRRKRSR